MRMGVVGPAENPVRDESGCLLVLVGDRHTPESRGDDRDTGGPSNG